MNSQAAAPVFCGKEPKPAAGSPLFPPPRVKASRRSVHVFLPAAGNRNGTTVNNAGSNGWYWPSTHFNSENSYAVVLGSSHITPMSSSNYRRNGRSVRLVKDVQCLLISN